MTTSNLKDEIRLGKEILLVSTMKCNILKTMFYSQNEMVALAATLSVSADAYLAPVKLNNSLSVLITELTGDGFSVVFL